MEKISGICGLWISPQCEVHLCQYSEEFGRTTRILPFQPFAWTDRLPLQGKFDEIRLAPGGPVEHLLTFETLDAYNDIIRQKPRSPLLEAIRPLENQFLLSSQNRMFEGLKFKDLIRCQCDIETASSVPGAFPDATRRGDRVLAIGLSFSNEDRPRFLVLSENTDAAERQLLRQFGEILRKMDPDLIEGHNIFSFDFNYLRLRCRMLKVPCLWGRFGQKAVFRKSRLRIAERWVDYMRCDLPGRAIFDTYLAIQIFDITTRDLKSYSLKDVAVYLGITQKETDERTYLAGDKIQDVFYEDRDCFLRYLGDDLRETRGVADLLLPTYVAQASNFPMQLQEIILRGTANKVELMLLEEYFHQRQSLPAYPEVHPFEGGFSKSFVTGVYRKVLHFDVASLYPSLLLLMDRNPSNDPLGIFIPLLKKLREYRLKYKNLARQADSEELLTEYQARQTSFKILINSFYGYLGFGNARFADGELAAEVTRRGRELLQDLITAFEEAGACVLEADTDGIYLSFAEFFDNPDALLRQVMHVLPRGIDLEFDGRYESMFCYGAKNYALFDGQKVTVRGSALRSRGMEPFLKELTDCLLNYLLGVSEIHPREFIRQLEMEIESGKIPIERIAKSEYLSKSPENYRKLIDSGGKPRRASLEVALTLDPLPKAGDKVSYYITRREKGRTSDWQRARAIHFYEPLDNPYDPSYYLKKLNNWLKRYGGFLESARASECEKSKREQTELF